MKLLHIDATPRPEDSATHAITNALLTRLAERDCELDLETLDLFAADLPAAAGEIIQARYALGAEAQREGQHAESWARIERAARGFRSADVYVLSAPMWNLGVPYALKYYIDCVVHPVDLFGINGDGIPTPLLEGKRMLVVSSSGSDYREESPLYAFDYFEPYLRAIFGFAGITEMRFVRAHGVDLSAAMRDAAIAHAMTEVTEIAAQGWLGGPAPPPPR